MARDPFDMLYDSLKEHVAKTSSEVSNLASRCTAMEVKLESVNVRILILYGAITVVSGGLITALVKLLF